MQAQLLELKSKDFESNFKLEQMRKKLLKSLKSNLSNKLRDHVKNLNVEIKNHFVYKSSVRRRIIPGDLKYLWDAVKISKDMNTPKLPHTMHLNNNEIPINELPEVFAEFFESKVKSIVEEQLIIINVFNGER